MRLLAFILALFITDCTADALSITDPRTRAGNAFQSYVHSGCDPVVTAPLTLSALTCEAWVTLGTQIKGVEQPAVDVLLPATDGTHWVAIFWDNGGAAIPGWTHVPSSHIYHQAGPAFIPGDPDGAHVFLRVIVAGGTITRADFVGGTNPQNNKVIDITDHAIDAQCNGAGDDGPAIQKALFNACYANRSVYVPHNWLGCRINTDTTTVVIDDVPWCGGITMWGDGVRSLVTCVGSNDCFRFGLASSGASMPNVTITDMSIQSLTPTSGWALDFELVPNALVRNVSFSHAGTHAAVGVPPVSGAIRMNLGWSSRIIDSIFGGAQGNGVAYAYLFNSTFVPTITGNRMDGGGGTLGIGIQASIRGGIIAGNTIESLKTCTIIDGSTGVTFTGNYHEKCETSYEDLGSSLSMGMDITANYFAGDSGGSLFSQEVIVIDNTLGTTIKDNLFDGHYQTGFPIHLGTNATGILIDENQTWCYLNPFPTISCGDGPETALVTATGNAQWASVQAIPCFFSGASTHTGDTLETDLFNCTIPHGRLFRDVLVKLDVSGDVVGIAGGKTIRLRMNGIVVGTLQQGAAEQDTWAIRGTGAVQGNASTVWSTMSNQAALNETYFLLASPAAINQPVVMRVTGQLTTATDSITLRSATAEIQRNITRP